MGRKYNFSVMTAFFPQNAYYYLHTKEGRKELVHFIKIAMESNVTMTRSLLYYPFNTPLKVLKNKTVNAPWVVVKKGKRYVFDLEKFSKEYWKYFEELLWVFKYAGFIPIIAPVDWAQKHRPKDRHHSPFWEANKQEINLYNYEITKYLFPLYRKTVETLRKVFKENFYIELANEMCEEHPNNYRASLILKEISDFLEKTLNVPRNRMIVPTSPKGDYYHNLSLVSYHQGGNIVKYRGVIPDFHFGRLDEKYKEIKNEAGWRWMWQNYNRIMLSTDGAVRYTERLRDELPYIDEMCELFNLHKKSGIIETQPKAMWGPEREDRYYVIRGHLSLHHLKKDFLDGIYKYIMKALGSVEKNKGSFKKVEKYIEKINISESQENEQAEKKSWLEKLIEFIMKLFRR